MILPKEFYLNDDVVQIARELIGKYLFTGLGSVAGGIITETEAYAGAVDKASHAYNNRRTKRTEIMFSEGGRAYVYLCYGVHSLFNVVTNKEDIPHAVLIRGIYPVEGIETMLQRTGKNKIDRGFGIGPGKVSKALGIHFSHSGISLSGKKIWIEDKGLNIDSVDIKVSKRIGIDYAGEDAGLPYRFYVTENFIRERLSLI